MRGSGARRGRAGVGGGSATPALGTNPREEDRDRVLKPGAEVLGFLRVIGSGGGPGVVVVPQEGTDAGQRSSPWAGRADEGVVVA